MAKLIRKSLAAHCFWCSSTCTANVRQNGSQVTNISWSIWDILFLAQRIQNDCKINLLWSEVWNEMWRFEQLLQVLITHWPRYWRKGQGYQMPHLQPDIDPDTGGRVRDTRCPIYNQILTQILAEGSGIPDAPSTTRYWPRYWRKGQGYQMPHLQPDIDPDIGGRGRDTRCPIYNQILTQILAEGAGIPDAPSTTRYWPRYWRKGQGYQMPHLQPDIDPDTGGRGRDTRCPIYNQILTQILAEGAGIPDAPSTTRYWPRYWRKGQGYQMPHLQPDIDPDTGGRVRDTRCPIYNQILTQILAEGSGIPDAPSTTRYWRKGQGYQMPHLQPDIDPDTGGRVRDTRCPIYNQILTQILAEGAGIPDAPSTTRYWPRYWRKGQGYQMPHLQPDIDPDIGGRGRDTRCPIYNQILTQILAEGSGIPDAPSTTRYWPRYWRKGQGYQMPHLQPDIDPDIGGSGRDTRCPIYNQILTQILAEGSGIPDAPSTTRYWPRYWRKGQGYQMPHLQPDTGGRVRDTRCPIYNQILAEGSGIPDAPSTTRYWRKGQGYQMPHLQPDTGRRVRDTRCPIYNQILAEGSGIPDIYNQILAEGSGIPDAPSTTRYWPRYWRKGQGYQMPHLQPDIDPDIGGRGRDTRCPIYNQILTQILAEGSGIPDAPSTTRYWPRYWRKGQGYQMPHLQPDTGGRVRDTRCPIYNQILAEGSGIPDAPSTTRYWRKGQGYQMPHLQPDTGRRVRDTRCPIYNQILAEGSGIPDIYNQILAEGSGISDAQCTTRYWRKGQGYQMPHLQPDTGERVRDTRCPIYNQILAEGSGIPDIYNQILAEGSGIPDAPSTTRYWRKGQGYQMPHLQPDISASIWVNPQATTNAWSGPVGGRNVAFRFTPSAKVS